LNYARSGSVLWTTKYLGTTPSTLYVI